MLLFGALVAVHEFGHFITAKMSGVRVNEFAIGMGPAILKKKFGETVYALRILPFGGYCAMEGEDSESDDPRAFSSRPVLYRILIVLAGSIMNLIAGLVVLSIALSPVKSWSTTTVESVGKDVPMSESFLMPGDTIKSINGYNVYINSDIYMGMSRGNADNGYDFEVIRNGKKVMLPSLHLVAADGKESDSGQHIEIHFKVEQTSFWGKTRFVLRNGFNLARLIKIGLVDLISGNVSRDQLSGPIGIGKVMADTAKTSMPSLWLLLAFISINLGIMNLLPLPALDGGRFVFLLIELVMGKPVAPKYEGYIHMAGLALLMLLMVYVTYNDIVKLIIK